MSLKSPLGRVLGLGTGRGATHHFWVQRVSAVALVPLSVWFVVSLAALPDLAYGTARAWAGEFGHAFALLLLIATAAYHSQLGVQVIVEDYVPQPGRKVVVLVTSTFVHVAAAAAGMLAVIKMALGSGA